MDKAGLGDEEDEEEDARATDGWVVSLELTCVDSADDVQESAKESGKRKTRCG